MTAAKCKWLGCNRRTTDGYCFQHRNIKVNVATTLKALVPMTTKTVVEQLASSFQAWVTCSKTNNNEWLDKHEERIEKLVHGRLPSGSGFDSGTKLDYERSTPERLVFTTSFHHMNESGYYDGWTEHTVTVTPSFVFGVHLKISGKDRNDIKEYIDQCFRTALEAPSEDL